MADLTIENIRTCAANLGWSRKVTGSKGDLYTVSYGPDHGGGCGCGWSCDCPAGRHGKACKHVAAAKAEKCDWNWEAFMGSHAEANPDGTCPKCGGPTEVVRVGV